MRSIQQVRALVRLVARRPGAVRDILRWKPFSITSYEMARALKQLGVHPGVVIDAGANIGQFARAIAETFPDARVISFEPHPDAARRYVANLSDCHRAELHPVALGSCDGEVAFYPQEYDLASSVLPPLAHEEGGHGITPLIVPVARLDSVLARESLSGPVLLKMDLQGYELEALRGSADILGQIRWILLETSFQHSYEGEPDFEAILHFLSGHGFRFVRPVDFLRSRAGEIVQMDGLFANANA